VGADNTEAVCAQIVEQIDQLPKRSAVGIFLRRDRDAPTAYALKAKLSPESNNTLFQRPSNGELTGPPALNLPAPSPRYAKDRLKPSSREGLCRRANPSRVRSAIMAG
jgi:hypothetical protein